MDLHSLQFSMARHKSSHSAVYSPVSSGNVFKWQTSPFLWVCKLSPCLSHSLSYPTLSNYTLTLNWISGRHWWRWCLCDLNWSEMNKVLPKVKAKSMLFGTHDQLLLFFKLSLDSSGFAYVGRLHWREVGSIVYSCYWASSAQSFSGLSLAGFTTIFCCLKFETPSIWMDRLMYLFSTGTGWTGSCTYFPQEQGSPVMLSKSFPLMTSWRGQLGDTVHFYSVL
jgi:hypothetical protein